ncbi:MAG: FtsX-like permease family protein [Acidobacteria bacterium]|nr:FtsX-like permease family protein [Acidobacteriota bacterium]
MLAWRNLVHDKIRLAVTVTGIVFAVVLIVVELGLFIGFTTTTSSLIDQSGADLWISARNVPFIEQGTPFSERKLSTVMATPGVAAASKYVLRFAEWKRPDGGQDSVLVVGFDLQTRLGAPWNIIAGQVDDLRQPDAVFIDDIYRERLGAARVGQVVEVQGRRARIAGFTQGIRAFTTSPYVFTRFKAAQNYTVLREDETVYLLVKAKPNVDVEGLRRRLAARLPSIDVMTTAEFSRRTRLFWMFTTGAGLAVLLAAVLGLVVGIVIVAQTIYATTVDHIREYATLKAIGASNWYLYKVIVLQAVISALIGYALGIVIAVLVIRGSKESGAAILLPPGMVAGMLVLTLVMCVSAAIFSIRKVTRLDPALVFKG